MADTRLTAWWNLCLDTRPPTSCARFRRCTTRSRPRRSERGGGWYKKVQNHAMNDTAFQNIFYCTSMTEGQMRVWCARIEANGLPYLPMLCWGRGRSEDLRFRRCEDEHLGDDAGWAYLAVLGKLVLLGLEERLPGHSGQNDTATLVGEGAGVRVRVMAEWFPVIWLGRAGELRGGHRHPERALRLESSTPCDAAPAWRGCRAPRRVQIPRTRPIPPESSKRASNETKASGCDGL